MKNTIKGILRYSSKNKLFTALNIVGLAIGISACWMVFSIVQYEFSFNTKVPQIENVYQVYAGNSSDVEDKFAGVPLGMPPLLASESLEDALIVPVYEAYFERLFIPQNKGKEQLVFEDERNMIRTQSSYFELLPFEWIVGHSKMALDQPNHVVLTEKRSQKYFPDLTPEEIIGKIILADTTQLTIAGIVKELSFPTSFYAEMFMPITDQQWQDHTWHGLNSQHTLYVRSENLKSLGHLIGVGQKRYDEVAKKDHEKYGSSMVFGLYPLKDKHFSPYMGDEHVSEKKVLYGLIAIGCFLLLLACINYINLSTAQVPMRAKEIGVRKTLGARPGSLTLNFFLETFCMASMALLLSWPIVLFFKKAFPEFVPTGMESYENAGLVILFLIGLVVFMSFLSALYPSFLINKVRSIETLKGSVTTKIGVTGITLRKSLIVFQFVIAQFFIVCALIIGKQLNFTLTKDLGFDHDAVVTLRMPYKSYQDADVDPLLYKTALKKETNIQAVAMGHDPQSNNHWGSDYYLKSDTGDVQLLAPRKYIDEDFIDLYKIEFLAGGNVLKTGSYQDILINETALHSLGFLTPEQAIGQFLTVGNAPDQPRPIVGVFKDFHQKSLITEIGPLVLEATTRKANLQTFHIKLPKDRKKWTQVFTILENEWSKVYPNAPFAYEFADNKIKQLYEAQARMSKLIGLATGVMIFISALGLFGLALLTAVQRIKEVGIRKVLGASVSGIVTLLSKDFLKLVCLAIVIASPLAWWAMNKWLDNFAYKVEIGSSIFMVAGLITVLIAFFTVSWHAIRGAVANPVDSLRDE